jgi:hypothetical protein
VLHLFSGRTPADGYLSRRPLPFRLMGPRSPVHEPGAISTGWQWTASACDRKRSRPRPPISARAAANVPPPQQENTSGQVGVVRPTTCALQVVQGRPTLGVAEGWMEGHEPREPRRLVYRSVRSERGSLDVGGPADQVGTRWSRHLL